MQLRRGPYVIAAVLDESVSGEPLHLRGRMMDLLDARLPVRDEVVVQPANRRGSWTWIASRPRRRRYWRRRDGLKVGRPTAGGVRYTITSPEGINVVSRILLPVGP